MNFQIFIPLFVSLDVQAIRFFWLINAFYRTSSKNSSKCNSIRKTIGSISAAEMKGLVVIYEFSNISRFPRFTGRNCAAVTVATSVRSKLATSLVGSGTPVCACADVHWRLYNSAPLISSLTLPTAASKYPIILHTYLKSCVISVSCMICQYVNS